MYWELITRTFLGSREYLVVSQHQQQHTQIHVRLQINTFMAIIVSIYSDYVNQGLSSHTHTHTIFFKDIYYAKLMDLCVCHHRVVSLGVQPCRLYCCCCCCCDKSETNNNGVDMDIHHVAGLIHAYIYQIYVCSVDLGTYLHNQWNI